MASGFSPAAPQLLGALVNLAVARPTVLAEMRSLGTLDVVVPLIDPAAYPPSRSLRNTDIDL